MHNMQHAASTSKHMLTANASRDWLNLPYKLQIFAKYVLPTNLKLTSIILKFLKRRTENINYTHSLYHVMYVITIN